MLYYFPQHCVFGLEECLDKLMANKEAVPGGAQHWHLHCSLVLALLANSYGYGCTGVGPCLLWLASSPPGGRAVLPPSERRFVLVSRPCFTLAPFRRSSRCPGSGGLPGML